MFTYQKEYKHEEKKKNKLEILIKGIIALFNFVTLILLVVWLFKIIKNAHEEPKLFASFVDNDSSSDYSEGDFCYGRKYEFSNLGALKLFNINMDKIKKFSIGLLVSKFISILLVIFAAYAKFLYDESFKTEVAEKNILIFSIIYTILYLINCVLNVVFYELLSNKINDSNFEDFEKFEKCKYLIGNFKKKYEFIINVKNNSERIGVVNFISSILEALNIF